MDTNLNFLFSIFELFCLYFYLGFWLLYLICERVDFFSIRLSVGEN